MQQLLDSLSKIATDVQVVTGDLADSGAGQPGQPPERHREPGRHHRQAAGARRGQRPERHPDPAQHPRLHQRPPRHLRPGQGADPRHPRERGAADRPSSRSRPRACRASSSARPASPVRSAPPGAPGEAGAPGGPGGQGAPGAGAEPGVARSQESPAPRSRQQAKGVQQAVEKLNDNLAKLDEILGKVKEGKSVAGKLLVDERMGRQVGNAVEGLSDYFDRLNSCRSSSTSAPRRSSTRACPRGGRARRSTSARGSSPGRTSTTSSSW